MKLRIARNGRSFELDGAPVFLLADTCWSAFTHPSLEEWREYLDFRREQNFNAVQINLLPQRHSCDPREWRHPFAVTEDGRYDYGRIRTDYFDHVCACLDEMKGRGMVPLLVLLWGNYVPGSWQGERDAGRERVEEKPCYLPMSHAEMEGYLAYAVGRVKDYDPVFLVSGDVNLSETERAAAVPDEYRRANPDTIAFYRDALRLTKRLAPDCLATLHVAPLVELPGCLAASPDLDFYMYQPGHRIDMPDLNRTLARALWAAHAKRPVYNSETSYEANVYFDRPKGRFDERQVRRAFWHGALSGANAGFTYGAGGVWLWRQDGARCSVDDDTGLVNDWRDDLRLPGAADAAFGRAVLEGFGAWELEPADIVRVNPCGEIVAAATPGRERLMLYLPFSYPVRLGLDLSGCELLAVDLETRDVLRPAVTAGQGETRIAQLRFNHDYLILAWRKGSKWAT